jgi:antitoxin component of MazEF toxin-antitoxin module
LTVRIPLPIAKRAGLGEGDSVSLTLTRDNAIVLRPARCNDELSALVSQITPRNRHRPTQWGAPQGEESW